MPIAPDLCGTALDGRYELHALVGEGTFGRVYRGRDRRLARPVAVKVIKPWWAEDPEWAARFAREAQLLARLSDPGIVQIHDVGQAPEGLYYVSELVDGEDLAQRLRRGRLPVDEARTIAVGLCRALAGAHAQGVVHRDVKPANVLLAADGRVKVGDFGVARLAEGSTHEHQPSVLVGTPRYTAPEQGRGLPTTAATDVYAVGVVVYEMLAGRPPFTGSSPVALALGHLRDPPPSLPAEVPRQLARVVARALTKDPADRYADAGEMAEALAPARDDSRVLVGAAVGAAVGASAAVGAGTAVGVGTAVDAGTAPSDPRRRRTPTPAPSARPATSPHPRLEATRTAPRRGPRTTVNPSARRRTAAMLSGAGALLGALVVAALLTGGHVRPRPARAVAAVAAPVEVPLLVGESSTDAQARLSSLGLRAAVHEVPAPGITPGTVTSQAPVAGGTVPARSEVGLSVSEVPRWRPVTTVTARGPVSFRIRGRRWRLVFTVTSAEQCTLLVFCSGSRAEVTRDGSSAPLAGVDLSDGGDQTRVLVTGPGVYALRVDPASGDTRWSISVQDDY